MLCVIGYENYPHPNLWNVNLTPETVEVSCDLVSHYFLMVQKDKQPAEEFTFFFFKAFDSCYHVVLPPMFLAGAHPKQCASLEVCQQPPQGPVSLQGDSYPGER